MSFDIGLYGLAVMGQNFALNMAEHGFRVAVCNRSPEKVDTTVERAKKEGNLPLEGFKNPADFVKSLKTPRKIIMLVMAGKPVDETIELLSQYLQPQDLLIDGGNEWFPNTIRRAKLLEPKGILFMGMGISGGEKGARNGPSLMPGGPPGSYEMIEPIITKCAAQVADGPCTFNIGGVGSGNYVKMVHNGIEYGDMQLIAEAYDILQHIGGVSNGDLAKVFSEWNQGELQSFLIEITASIFEKQDDLAEGYVIDKILDKTGMKGTGRWTIQEAAERNCPSSVMSAALDSRYISARKEERVDASTTLQGPKIQRVSSDEKVHLINNVRQALYAAKIVSYAQGMNLIREAGNQLGWDIDLGECARIWKGGCIIRAAFLDHIQTAFKRNKNLPNLMVDCMFAKELNARQLAWRKVVSTAQLHGIPCPAMASALAYYDAYRCARLPANLTQAQRDFFGGHTYERIDRSGTFHCRWSEAHHDIGDLSGRTKGNM